MKNHANKILLHSPAVWALMSFSLLLSACGGSDDRTVPVSSTAVQKGVFLDGRVEGLSYSTSSLSGLTNAAGEYTFREGEVLTFKIGGITLGSATGAAILTPKSLLPGSSIDTPAVLNISRLLLSLDTDGDSTNGIQISEKARALAKNATVDFAAGNFCAPGSPEDNLIKANDPNRSCTDAPTARAELSKAESQIASGHVNEIPVADAGSDLIVTEGVTVTLRGKGSDSDGTVVGAKWTQVSGPAVTLSSVTAFEPTFTAPQVSAAADLKFRLVVRDNSDATSQPDEVTVTVQDSAPPAQSTLSVNSVADVEGDSGTKTLTFTITRAGKLDQAVSVRAATANGTATAGTDYVAADRIVSFASGETSKIFEVTVNGDTDVEDDETFTVNLSNATGDTSITGGVGTGTIQNDDVPSSAQSTLTINDVSALEGNSGTKTFVFTVTRGGNTAQLSTVHVATADGTATAGSDYVAVADNTISFASGETTKTVSVTVNGDTTVEADETFTVDLSSPSANATITRTRGTGTILNDDVTAPGQSTLSINSVTMMEGNSGTKIFAFTITRGGNTAQASTVHVATADGTATTADNDYVAVADTTVSFAAGETSKTVNVTVNGDTKVESDETFTVNLSNPSANTAITSGQGAGTGTIQNDDVAGFPLCVPDGFPGAGNCLKDIPTLGPILQGAVDTLYNALVGSTTPPTPAANCPAGKLCVGAAKRSVSPSAQHIAGVPENRLAGAAKRNQKFNLGGFGINPTQNLPDPFGMLGEQLTKPAEGVYSGSKGIENLYVRAFVIEQANGERVAFVTLDATGAGNVIQKGLMQKINHDSCDIGACIAEANVVFGQTHTHAGPDLQGLWGGVPQDWIENTLYKQASAAVMEALQNLQPAKLTVAQGTTLEFNNYRRPKVDPTADSDGTLTLLRARRLSDDTPIGSILQYSAHPTSIDENPRLTHPDFILGAMDWLEDATHFGGTALYYNGPIADASGSGSRAGCSYPTDANYGNVRCRGEGIAKAGTAFDEGNALQSSLTVRHVEAILPVTNPLFVAAGLAGAFNRYYDFAELPTDQIPGIGPMIKPALIDLPQVTPTAKTLVSRITIGGTSGGLDIVTIPGEATNTYGQYIRSLNKNNKMMLMGLTHNSFGYIIPEEEFSYIDPSGDSGFTAPFTGYEEFVSLGPLTAPLLRTQAYNVLFDQAPEKNIPPELSACQDPKNKACAFTRVAQNVDYIQRSYAQQCVSAGGPAAFCSMLNPDTPLHQPCVQAGFDATACNVFAANPEPGSNGLLGSFGLRDNLVTLAEGCRDNIPAPFDAMCVVPDTLLSAYDSVGGGTPGAPSGDAALIAAAADAQARGCDPLDTTACLYPFPSDYFTAAAPAGSPQSIAKGGTGKRVNFNILAMPRNIAGKPIDPTEWNRNDGFSPGAMIVTLVPGLDLAKTYAPATSISIANPEPSQLATAPIMVLDATDQYKQQLVSAEMDFTANVLLHTPTEFQGQEVPGGGNNIPNPRNFQQSLIIRPAKNFEEGHRYIVVLRNLKDKDGNKIAAGPAFKACLATTDSALPPIKARCDELKANVLTKLPGNIDKNDLFLAWDFTVASKANVTGRLDHMVSDALNSLNGGAPQFTVDKVTPNPKDGIAKRIEGTLTVPSYVIPMDPSPQDNADLQKTINQITAQFPSDAGDVLAIASTGNVPPNRLYYQPAPNPNDPQGSLYGDGLPDRVGGSATMSVPFICQIPKSASASNKARAGVYGHGLLDSRAAVNYDGVPEMSREHNYMFCAVDFYGFATGDLPNVASTLVDLSNFQVIPDASQQGIVNFAFLARAIKTGFANNKEFKDANGNLLFDNSDVFYDGNSQGGILGGVVVAASPDVNRGVLGSLGMNYSTLLRRSKDFDPYAVPLYLAYQDAYDRNLAFSLMQMLWDRSENNGYAQALRNNPSDQLASNGGQSNYVLLNSMFGDHQVTMWSADVMARTIGIPASYQMNDRVEHGTGANAPLDTTRPRHPDIMFGGTHAGLPELTYSPTQVTGSALVNWDDRRTAVPPIDDVPPRPSGAANRDPHDDSAKKISGRCQKAYFLRTGGTIFDITPMEFDGVACPLAEDSDGDGVRDSQDNCPYVANPGQEDANDNGTGDACESTPPPPAGGLPLCDPSPFKAGCLSDIPVIGGPLQGAVDTVYNAVSGGGGGTPGPSADGVAASLSRWMTAMTAAFGQFMDNPGGAFDTFLAGNTQLVADIATNGAQIVGQLANLTLLPPTAGTVNNPPPAPLMAGAAEGAIRVPVGTPLGGYLRPPVGGEYFPGAEAFAGGDPNVFLKEFLDFTPTDDACDPSDPGSCTPSAPIPDELRKVHSPYATYSPPSRGYYDSLIAKAVAMYDGHDCVILMKTDFVGMIDEVVQAVAEDATAKLRASGKLPADCDLKQGLVMSATHTHDGPGAVGNHSVRYFWLALDAYQPEIFERIVPMLADVVVNAVSNMQLARFGYAIGQEADGANGQPTLNSYRRKTDYAQFDNNCDDDGLCNNGAKAIRKRLGVLRVDKADGTPLAVVMNYAAHGIAFDVENQYFSGDVLASAEREVEASFGQPVVAMLVQNTGGNVSPRADGGPTLQRIERFGKLLAPQVRAIYDGVNNFDSRPDLRAVSQRIVLSREKIGYPDNDGKNGDGDYPYPNGAAQCGNDVAVPFADVGYKDLKKADPTPVSGMLPVPEKLPGCIAAPPPDAIDLADNGVGENGTLYPQDTRLTAVKIGSATLLTQPGEPLSEYGIRLLKAAKGKGFDLDKTFIWGYSQDHVGYIMEDDKEDWSQGGTEGTTTFWGWKLGDRLIKANEGLMTALKTDTAPPADELTVNYDLYRDQYKKVPRYQPTPSARYGRTVTKPKTIERFQQTSFAWEGGDPVLDYPSVTMQSCDANGANCVDAKRPNGTTIDTFYEMHLKYRLVSAAHVWTVEFESPKDWPAGTYRFKVAGKAWLGSEVPYNVISDAFTVKPSPTLQLTAPTTVGSSCAAKLAYTPRPNNYRLIDPELRVDLPAPVRSGKVIFKNGNTTLGSDSTPEISVIRDTNQNITAINATYAIDGACPADVTASGVDAYGNTAPASSGSADTDGDGVPDSSDSCPTQPGPASNNGCPVQTGGFPVRLCQDFMGDTYCLSDIPTIGPMIQSALDMAYNAVTGGGGPTAPADPTLVASAADAQLRGCDMLDPAHCLYPFPSNHYTLQMADGNAAKAQNIYTGRRVNLSPLAMPRNIANKPIDPTEWNRNDGFSTGAMLITYVPGLDRAGLLRTFGFTPNGDPDKDNRVGITNPELSLSPNSPILVLDADTGEQHPVWAEMDANADYILPKANELGGNGLDRPQPGLKSLIIRPARNFTPGHRYIAILRNLKDKDNKTIAAQSAFAACRGSGVFNSLPVLSQRCAELEADVFQNSTFKTHIGANDSLYLAWDFTIASAQNTTSRLTHMRDDAFSTLAKSQSTLPIPLPGSGSGQADCSRYDYATEPSDLSANADGYVNGCRSPKFTVDKVEEVDGGDVIQIQGTLSVPSYLVPADSSPLEAAEVQTVIDQMKQVPGAAQIFDNDLFFTAQPFNAVPPNYLNYNPADALPQPDPNAANLLPYGDGLPDRVAGQGEMTTRYLCEVKKSVYNGTEPAARPSLYGHGLLQTRAGLTYDENRLMVKRNGFMLCGLDWFGFSQGDLHNVAISLIDMSYFRAIPDASQQGMLNFMFLARAMQHPGGFASNPAFQKHNGAGGQPTGTPYIDRREIFYYGNSQGGILPAPVVAVSKDVNRGVFGVPGMNYSTLLRRSTDFTLYSIPLYLSYQNELDRNLVFGLIQMIWDRSENDGYAAYLTGEGKAKFGGLSNDSNLDGQENHVLLHPAFGDHQVTYWSADVMARTMGVKADRQQIAAGTCSNDQSKCEPDRVFSFGLEALTYGADGKSAEGSAEVIWRDPEVKAPPIVELPPHKAENGPDPHGYPRTQSASICQMSQFLQVNGFIADINAINRSFARDNYDAALAECARLYGTPQTITKPGLGDGGNPAPVAQADYGPGVLGVIARFFASLNNAIVAAVSGNFQGAADVLVAAFGQLTTGLAGVGNDMAAHPSLATLIGDDPQAYAARETKVNRDAEAVVLTGDKIPAWSVPAAQGAPYPYPSGAGITNQGSGADQLAPLNQVRDPLKVGEVRSAHNGVMTYPQAGAPMGVEVDRIAAYQFKNGAFVEVPVQVDQRYPYFLANAQSTFSIYSGTDEELSYEWDVERWGNPGEDAGTEDLKNSCIADYSAYRKGGSKHTPDPVSGLDNDDEIVFMYQDAGDMAAPNATPATDPDFDPSGGLQQIALADPLNAGTLKYVYLGLKKPGKKAKFAENKSHYVTYKRDSRADGDVFDADQWIDRSFFHDGDPEALGTSNSNYGPNRQGTVCGDANTPVGGSTPRRSTASGYDPIGDRFPRDGATVTTDRYLWRATGRWMVREIHLDNPTTPLVDYGPDLIDRWKGRAFQQSPDSTISVVGFEDEQVNWEANSTLLGERCGPVRCMREVWGADSGTNVTKTETFYRDAVASRYHVRVHPIPPDGLYTNWDYNRGAMVPTDAEKAAGVPGGRYFTALRPNGVPVDGINDDVGQVDQVSPDPVAGMCMTSDGPQPASKFAGRCPLFSDVADPAFNLPLAFNNWEQVSGKGANGSLVYIFELKGATSLANPLVLPYYRDDACLDDGTGDDPVQRPYPGETSTDPRVKAGYSAAAGGTPYDQLRCDQKQGAYAAHGVHYIFTHDSDNLFVEGKPSTEIDGQWWQFMVPTAKPENRGAEFANTVRVPVQTVVTPHAPPSGGSPDVPTIGGDSRGLLSLFGFLSSGNTQQAQAVATDAAANPAGAVHGTRDEAAACADDKATSACALPSPLGSSPAVGGGAFKVGAAKKDSTPNYKICTGGYGIFCGWLADGPRSNAIGGKDRLFTRAMAIESGGSPSSKIVIVTTSAIGLFASYKDEVTSDGRTLKRPGLYDTRVRISQATGVPFDHIFIQSDHSHRSPDTIGIWGGVPAAYLQQLQDDMLSVATESLNHLESAKLYVAAVDGGSIACPAQYKIAPGSVETAPMRCEVKSLYNYDPLKMVDNQFRILEARRPDDSRIATFANYSTHATVLDDTGSAVLSGDWTGWLATMLDDTTSCGGTNQNRCAVGLATVGTLGRTDFESGNNTGEGDARNLNRERAARARLTYFLDKLRSPTPVTGVTPFTPVEGTGIQTAEIFMREMVTNPIFYGNYAPIVGVPQRASEEYPSTMQAHIDRNVLPPFLTGNVLGTFAGAFRIGNVFFATAPGEEFPNAQERIRDQSGVTGPQMHFFMGATNDFLGYMGPAAAYDQVAAQGLTYLAGCPENRNSQQMREALNTATKNAGYESGRLFDEGSCPDHFVLMSSPTIGDHVACTIQDAAEQLGFKVEKRDPACLALTATDGVMPPASPSGGLNSSAAQGGAEGGLLPLINRLAGGLLRAIADAMSGAVLNVVGGMQSLIGDLIGGAYDALIGNPRSSVLATVTQTLLAGSGNPSAMPAALQSGLSNILNGYAGEGTVKAGVAVVDMTPDVGYCAGQYCAGQDDTAAPFDFIPEFGGNDGVDPFVSAKTKQKSYGVQSRETARAIVVEGSNGKRVALVKSDNYLAQDALIRRVAQILQQGQSGIGYDQILYGVTHNHTASYSSSVAWGVAVFEDVFDPRFFENQARKLAQAIEQAAATMVPAKMGATTVRHTIFKGNVVRLATADDGTPAGYPLEYGDHGLVVMRFDNASTGKPLAVWINWGEHPENLDPYDLHSADFLGPLERYVERDLGAPLVFSQGDVGSAEAEGNKTQLLADDGRVCGTWEEAGNAPTTNSCRPGEGVLRVWEHAGYVQTERSVRYLADAIKQGWDKIGQNTADVQVPMSDRFVVDYRNAFVPGPVSHPYPSVSNCKTDATAGGDVGVPVVGLPDCGRFGFPGNNAVTAQAALIYATAKAEGVPVPDHYDFTGFTGVEENARIKLQTVRLGEVLLASCACEAQMDLILNLESRANNKVEDIYDGFDWTCLNPPVNDPYAQACALQKQYYDPAEFPTAIPGSLVDASKVARMRAQIHNDARGWDLPQNALAASSEATDVTRIWGNFTKEELPARLGYTLPVGIGHAGDYNGYTVSYREYMNRDSYRKALTAYGPHTADYMVTRLVRMAGAMKGGPELQAEPQDTMAQADEARQKALSTALGQTTSAAYDAWQAALPMDKGPEAIKAQPTNITLFNAATMTWVGGSTQTDNPVARVERLCSTADLENPDQPLLAQRCSVAGVGQWVAFADMTGEVQTMVKWPKGLAAAAPSGAPEVASAYAGQYEWQWTANFEAYTAMPARLGSTPLGSYRFVVKGCINDGLSNPQTTLQGNATGRLASFLKLLAPDGANAIISNALGQACPGGARPYELVSNEFRVDSGAPKRTYTSAFPFISAEATAKGRDKRVCERCSFRPWARPGDEP